MTEQSETSKTILDSVGVPPPQGVIPLCVPFIGGNEWEYVKECLDTNWVSSAGRFVDRFEDTISAYAGTKFAVATSSGTAALHIALLTAGVEPEDEVLVSTLTFIATANAVRYAGAWPVFIDAESEYWQMDPEQLTKFLKNECLWQSGSLVNKTSGRRVKAVLPVHILGHPCDMDPIRLIAHEYGLAVVEDATESLGARYKGENVGHLGDVACFSFNGNKLVTTGGGGMVVTDNPDWAERAKYLTTQSKNDPVEYIHNEIGYNYRLTNLQAAMGCAQMENIDDRIEAKRRIAASYRSGIEDVPGLTLMAQAPWAESVFWLSTVLVEEEHYGLSSRGLMQKLRERQIEARPLWQPLHLSPAHGGMQACHLEVAELLCRNALSLPSSVGLEHDDLDLVIRCLRELSDEAKGIR